MITIDTPRININEYVELIISKGVNNRSIGIDIDGVIADYVEWSLPFLRELTANPLLSKHDLKNHDLKQGLSLSDNQYKDLKKFFHNPNYYGYDMIDIPLINPDIPRIIRSWLIKGFNIYFITAREVNHFEITKRWLYKHEILFTNLYVAQVNKADCNIMRELNYYIDDSLYQLWMINETHKKPKLFLVDQPWNQLNEDDKQDHFQRVMEFTDIEYLI